VSGLDLLLNKKYIEIFSENQISDMLPDYCGICRSYNLVIRRSCLANQIAIPFFHIGPFLLVNWESSWIFNLLTWILLWNDMRFSILNLWRYLNILTKLPICKVWWIYFHGRKTVRHIIVRYFFTFYIIVVLTHLLLSFLKLDNMLFIVIFL
jgi:hypothetical protein